MIYTVVCTDLNDYINWQFELLEYSWSRVNQPGKLIRLVSCEAETPLPVHRHAEVFRTTPSNVHPDSGDIYVCYNRLYSLQQWLDQQAITGTILIVDADVVFRKPIKTEVPVGEPLGQHWLDYGVSDEFRAAISSSSSADVDTLQPVTWPALIDAQDLRKLMPRWIAITVSIREQIRRQECDMFAFLAAAQELDIQFRLGTTTAFMPWPDDQVRDAPIIHYCQPVQAQDGSELWFKGNYQAWNRVAGANTAKLAYCRDLVSLVDEFALLKSYQQTHLDDAIFIAIASYCEPELVDTINSCIEKARHPQNLRFGICHQFDNSDPLTGETCLDQFSRDSRFRYVVYNHKDSKGGCWARNIAQQLYNDESYTLQIDAHTRMLESWDTILIEMLNSLPSEKPLISQFPPLYNIDDGNFDFQYVDDLTQVNTAVALNWDDHGWLNHTQKLIAENNRFFPRKTRLFSGAFAFTSGEWNKVVMQDDEHFYTGEEFALAVRSFTHGYDLFDPNQIVAWHRYHPQANRKYWDDNTAEITQFRHDTAIHRLGLLLHGDPENELGKFGLGTERTLHDYYQLSGIDCINRTIDSAAGNGSLTGLTIMQPTSDNISGQSTDDPDSNFVDVTIHRENMASLWLACEESNPVLLALFQALRLKSSRPDDVIYLDLGETGEARVIFKQSQLISIETAPALSAAFFEQLASLSNQDSQQNAVQPATLHSNFPDDWKIWIWHNVSRGCPKDTLFKELIGHGFSWQAIQAELNHQPELPLDQIATNASAELQSRPVKYLASSVATRLPVEGLEIYAVDNFLKAHECAQLSDVIHSKLQSSTTVALDGSSAGRNSQTCFFNIAAEESAFALQVSDRISRLIGINPGYAEPIQAHVYNPGEEYKAHYDWFEPGTPIFQSQANQQAGGQRTWSVVVYLNNVEAGGNTDFPNIDLTIEPALGKLVFWNNIDLHGLPNSNALHQACPVIKGQKTVLTMWYRSLASGPMYLYETLHSIPRYTESGFHLTTIPKELFGKLSEFYCNSSMQDIRDEFVEGGFLQSATDKVPSSLIDIPERFRQQISEQLLPLCEHWCQRKLKLSSIYGIRVYARGASLKMHTDTSETHHISAILNIAQELSADWPLLIEDHMFRLHSINLNAGDMLLYEGARLKHGRPEPLNGGMYANIFVHFQPLEDPGKKLT